MDRHLPWTTPHGALHNARAALTQITDAAAHRLTLTDALVADETQPGSLTTMTVAECYELLSEEVVGRLAYVARADTPDLVPVNYVLDGGNILIRSGPGPKLQAAERRARVAFEVDSIDRVTQTGRSVVVVGRAVRLPPAEQRRHADLLAAWASGPRHAVIRILPTRITGRRLS